MFGGRVPLKTSTGRTFGYYDHQAARTGLEITSKYAAIAPFFVPAGWLEALPASGAARVSSAVSLGIEEAIQNHHAFPMFMGGPKNQALVAVRQGLHTKFHQTLASTLRKAEFPPVGGKTGSTTQWLNLFAKNSAKYDEAIEILRRVSSEFDTAHGTNIRLHLDKVLAEIVEKGPASGGR